MTTRSRPSLIASSLRFVSIVLSVLTLFAYFSSFISPAFFSISALFSLALPILLVINLIFLLLALLCKLWPTVILLFVCLLPGFVFLQRIYQFDKVETASNQAALLRVVSYNVRMLYQLDDAADDEWDVERLTEDLAQMEADVYCLQEVTGKQSLRTAFIDAMKAAGFLYVVDTKELPKLLLFSKLPISSAGLVLTATNAINGAVYADIQIDDNARIRVYNVHLQSNNRFLADDAQSPKRNKLEILSDKLQTYMQAAAIRVEQTKTLENHIAESPNAVIISGDLNDVPSSYTYQKVGANLVDSYMESGHGWGQTYQGNIPGLRIDYILHSPSLGTHSYQKYCLPYSDHCAIQATLNAIP